MLIRGISSDRGCNEVINKVIRLNLGSNQMKKTFSSWGIAQALNCHNNGNRVIRNNCTAKMR